MKFKSILLLKIIVTCFYLTMFSQVTLAQFQNNRLSQAVDNTSFDFVTESPPVFSQNRESNFDGDAIQTANISNDGVTVMATFVPNATTVTFDWKVSSELGYDFLALVVADSNVDPVGITREISGERDWATISVAIPAGGHFLIWGYLKDGSVSFGQDTGWVDNIRIGNTGGETTNQPELPSETSATIPPIIDLLLE